MVKRLTMLMGGLILSTGIALAQTTVTGKVISQEASAATKTKQKCFCGDFLESFHCPAPWLWEHWAT